MFASLQANKEYFNNKLGLEFFLGEKKKVKFYYFKILWMKVQSPPPPKPIMAQLVGFFGLVPDIDLRKLIPTVIIKWC